MNLRIDNCLYSLHADGIVSLDLDFKMQFGNRLLILLPNDHMPKIEKKEYKKWLKLLALLNRLQWAENEQYAKHLIYMWTEQ